jgi:hypothetical protein
LDFSNYGKWLLAALESSGEFEVASVPTWDFYNMEPGGDEKVLAEYDILIFSDVEAKNFQLHPQFFNRHLFGTKALTFPDRVRLTVEAVKAGTHMMFPGRRGRSRGGGRAVRQGPRARLHLRSRAILGLQFRVLGAVCALLDERREMVGGVRS